MGCRLSQKSTLQNHIYRNTFTEFSAHLAISSDDLAISSDDLAKSSAHLAISSDDLAISSDDLAKSSAHVAISSDDLAKSLGQRSSRQKSATARAYGDLQRQLWLGFKRLAYNMTLGQRFVPSLRSLSVSIPLACVELFIIQRLPSVFS